MPANKFPFIALVVGVLFFLILGKAGQVDAEGNYGLPLLALLGMAELGAIICAFGAWFSLKEMKAQGFHWLKAVLLVLCGLLGLLLAVMGIQLWPG